jgi:glutamate 5-kinase
MRIVIKIGSNLLTSGNGLDESKIASLCKEISQVHSSGTYVIVVSSGAIAAGMKKLGLKKKPDDIRHKQAAAAVGQSALMWAYEKNFKKYDKSVAQILITRDAFHDRNRYINARNTILTLFDYGTIPIINENDSVAVDEIKFGDNDQLASLVSGLVSADRLIILSDVDGLFTKDPRKCDDSQLIPTVEKITGEVERIAGGAGSSVGTGGMYSKLLAAKRAVRYGITVNIINGNVPGLISAVLSGNACGSEFKPQGKRVATKKGWIAFGLKVRGNIVIDTGAQGALIRRNKSLLPSGIVNTEGNFKAGDAVYCIDSAGNRIAKGLTNYSSDEIKEIMGVRTSEIKNILGYKYSDEVIHRDNLVVL